MNCKFKYHFNRFIHTIIILLSFILIVRSSYSQEIDKSLSIALYPGIINYQGDLNPNSFTFQKIHLSTGIVLRKPLGRWLAVRAGAGFGKLEAADKWNRDYLKCRNLSFKSNITEAHIALEFTFPDISTHKISPYVHSGIAVFHFNPWAYDSEGKKIFLKHLSTEGQGLPEYPGQKPYKLTQAAFVFGGGLKFSITNAFIIGIEMSQRKTFTDYLDDLSSDYVDRDVLYNARGPKAIELSYRCNSTDENRPLYPNQGDQRGNPHEMDWYYFVGINLELKFHAIIDFFKNSGNNRSNSHRHCPSNLGY